MRAARIVTDLLTCPAPLERRDIQSLRRYLRGDASATGGTVSGPD
jgi:hypothetical protein